MTGRNTDDAIDREGATLSAGCRTSAWPVRHAESPAPTRHRRGIARVPLQLPGLGPRSTTEAPREVCELALAHINTDRVEAAYRAKPNRAKAEAMLMYGRGHTTDPAEDRTTPPEGGPPRRALQERYSHPQGHQRADRDDGAGFHHHPPPTRSMRSPPSRVSLVSHMVTPPQKNSPMVIVHNDRRVECDQDAHPDLNGLVGHPQTHFVELTRRDSRLRPELPQLQRRLALVPSPSGPTHTAVVNGLPHGGPGSAEDSVPCGRVAVFRPVFQRRLAPTPALRHAGTRRQRRHEASCKANPPYHRFRRLRQQKTLRREPMIPRPSCSPSHRARVPGGQPRIPLLT